MAIKVKLPNGETIDVKEGQTPRQRVLEYMAQKDAEFGVNPDYQYDAQGRTTEEMNRLLEDSGAGRNFLAGVGSGMANIGRNVGNLVGLVDDDTVREANRRDAPLKDTTSGFIGSVVGEGAALAPTAGVGAGARGLMAARAAPGMLTRALASPIGTAAAEGAVGAYVAGGPDNRGRDAVAGALTGGALGMGGRALGRTLEGVVPKSQAARTLSANVEQATGKRPFIPVGLVADSSGVGGGAGSAAYRQILPLFPFVRNKMQRQVTDLGKDYSETVLRRALGGTRNAAGRRVADDASDLYRGGESFEAALASGERAAAKPNALNPTAPARRAATSAARKRASGNDLDSGEFLQAMRSETGNRQNANLMGLAQSGDEVLSQNLADSSPFGRQVFYGVTGTKGASSTVGKIADVVFGSVEALGAGPITAIAGSRGFQNFLMGDTTAQRLFQEALKGGSRQKRESFIKYAARNAPRVLNEDVLPVVRRGLASAAATEEQ